MVQNRVGSLVSSEVMNVALVFALVNNVHECTNDKMAIIWFCFTFYHELNNVFQRGVKNVKKSVFAVFLFVDFYIESLPQFGKNDNRFKIIYFAVILTFEYLSSFKNFIFAGNDLS